jgi:phosphomannomutase
VAARDGTTVLARLDAIHERFGRHITNELAVHMDPRDAAAAVEAMRADPPAELAGVAVTGVEAFPEANLLRLWCGTTRVQVRPSGTEPKVKLYGEGVGTDPTPQLEALAAVLTAS